VALPVVYRPKVGRDLAGGFGYYEGQAQGLGEQFLSAVNSAFDAIERYPEMFARVHGRSAPRSYFALPVCCLLPCRIQARGCTNSPAYRS